MGNACSSPPATGPATNAHQPPAKLDDGAAHRCSLSAVGHSTTLLSNEGSSHILSPLVLPPSRSLPMSTADVVMRQRSAFIPTESLAISASLLTPLPPPQREDRRAVVSAPLLHMAESLTIEIQLGTLSKPPHQRMQPPPIAASAIVQPPTAEAESCVSYLRDRPPTRLPHQTSAPFGTVAPQRYNATDAFCEGSDHDADGVEEFDEDESSSTRNLQSLGDAFLVIERAPFTRGSGGNFNELCPSPGQHRRSTGCIEPATPRSRSIGSSCSRHSRVSFLTHAVILGDHQIDDEDEEGCGGAGEVEPLVAAGNNVVEGGTRGTRRSSISIATDASRYADNGRMNTIISNFLIPATPRTSCCLQDSPHHNSSSGHHGYLIRSPWR
ncbi:Hypothetical protein, putative [Bodo saltans]|uniref:Uncharacterized protein n=1 Tax=Bodo saltans TaxID=75058 RepID=A0A0S4J877_BODSA|nr:Hypothetical protein, putative [Bodo saltans]|eukprot:CUG86425.1 Hypothetical protein, putative [Bodo saltans]